ncbi:related to Protoheme IX farnesyltransferase, mitochondrial [Lecanosticta acicola]|uniref:Protoheme IX farnesyltransferase, mitochondrial n=1 Tax=Lecanosticta acicola TaxID=111012 RepID=A0AAI8Z3B2_9PEZI|nr:related to Protoheme IX farnesyltransferase, mitochondrial [Lecanosticta acicola]
MLLRPSIAALHTTSNTSTICFRCAKRLARLTEPRLRSFSKAVRTRQIAVAKEDEVDRRFFWANAFHSSDKEDNARIWSRFSSNGRGVREAQHTSATTERPSSSSIEEPPHRRRKRLKAVAALDHATNTQLPPDASSTLSRDAAAAPANSWRRIISTYLALSKPRLAFLIVLTTTASYSIYPVPALLSTSVTDAPSLSTLTLLFLTSGTFSCIASANALNMLFETEFDAKMSRTRNRPLVRKLLSRRAAVLFAIATGLFGTGVLWYGVNPTTALLGAGNIALYGFAYTFSKRLHPVNTWVGAIVGAIPPLMGWCAAASQYSTTDASLSDPATIGQEFKELLFTEQAIGGWLIAALLFAWQFPHFFALSHGVRHEYANAGYKMLTSSNIPMAARVSLRYSFAMFPICAALSYYQVTDPAFVATSSVINAWMLREAIKMWRLNGEKGSARALFWASVWQLPIVLVLAMMQKKGLWDRVWSSVFGEAVLEDEWEEEMEEEGVS